MPSKPAHRSHYEDPNLAVAWAPGGLPRACMYWLEGRTHVVAQQSPAERLLQERGAFPVAILSFDEPAREHVAADSTIRTLPARDAAERYGRVSGRN